MSADECYITPDFVKNQPRAKVARHAGKVQKEETPIITNSIPYFFKKHQTVIIAFAIIIVILIVIIVWMFTTDKKINIYNDIPPPLPSILRASNDKPTIKQNDVPEKLNNPQTEQYRPPTESPKNHNQQDPEPKHNEPQTTINKTNIMSHDQIVNTVDDDELNKFINIKSDEQPKSNDIFDNLENYEADTNKH